MPLAPGASFELSRVDAAAVIAFGAELDSATFPHQLAAPLCDVLRELNADNTCRCIVLSLDRRQASQSALPAPQTSSAPLDLIGLRQRAQAVTTLFRDLLRGTKPIVGAVEGRMRSAGLALAAACDYVISADDASYCCDALGSGLLPDMGLLWNLPQKVGAGKARELFLLARQLDASEAQQAGLVNELTPPGQALKAALSEATRYEDLPLVALALLRASLVNGSRSFDASIRQELDLNPLARESADHPEAIAAFMEKRQPNFTGN